MSCSSSQWEQKLENREARDQDRCYQDDRSCRSSRWKRKLADHTVQDRNRDYRKDDGDSMSGERNPRRTPIGANQTKITDYKCRQPNNTIMIKGLVSHITEADIRQDIIHCGLMPQDIRLVRTKVTGASRGFAFIEFSSSEEATKWLDLKRGVLVLQDQCPAIMQYSIPKVFCQDSEKLSSNKAAFDWFCTKCGAQNFRRRENCFKCRASRMESEEGGSGSDEMCNYVTKTIMLRNLDALATEDSVIQTLNAIIPEVSKKISEVRIGRDCLTSTSRGICYLATDSIADALALYGALTNVTPLSIDGKIVIVSYCKYNMGNTEKTHEQAVQAVLPKARQSTSYTLSDVNQLAEYSASHYAKTVDEYHQYFEYYATYFAQQINLGKSITLPGNQADAANAAAAVAQSAMQRKYAAKAFNATQLDVPNGTDGKHYPIPDVTKYAYEKSSGFYYDSTTGLYYDPNSNYYWNNAIQKYLYYDQEKLTYLLALPSSCKYTNISQATEATTEPKSKKSNIGKNDKVKVAKKIAKDMERWAKTLNQKKELCTTSMSSFSNENNSSMSCSARSADIGYLVLEKKSNSSLLMSNEANSNILDIPSQALTHSPSGENEISDEEAHDEMEFLDFTKLICKLCRRQLSSIEVLTKHATFSELHKSNLEKFKAHSKKDTIQNNNTKTVYRDRAKERRMRYGETDETQSNELKDKYLKSRELADIATAASAAEPIGSDNVGNRLLQKMGWLEGQGLGKTNQGRTTIIQAEQRHNTVGLGNNVTCTALAGESYRDSAKKVLYSRYQEIH